MIDLIDPRTVLCTSCGAQIIFLRTAAGHQMPIDATTVSPEDEEYLFKKHKSHFATCTNPAHHRRPKK